MLPLAFQGLHLLVAGILIPSVVVHHTAAWFGAVYQHQLFQFIVRRGEIGYAFILGNLRIQNPCLDGVWSVVADSGWEHEVASVTLFAGKGECLFALYGLDDGCCIVLRLELALEVNIQRTAVLDVRHGIALVVVVSADIYHQSLTVLVGYCLTHDVALGIESLFCRLLFPVIITEIGEGKLLFACTNFQFSFRKIQSRIVFIYLMPASVVESLGGEGMLACLAELRMSHHQLGTWLQGDGIFASHALSEGGALKERELAGKHSLVVMPGCTIEIGCCQTEPLLWGRIFCGTVNLDVPDGATETILLSASIGEADVLRLGISEIYHRRTSQTVLSLVGEGLPVLAIIRCLDEILIELCSVFKLSPDALDALLLAQVNLNPGWSGGARAPECAVVVINRIFRTEVVVVIGRGCNLGAEGEVLCYLHLRFQIETFVGWNDLLDGTVCIEFEFIDCHLTMESTVGMRIVVAMIYDVVVVTFLEHAVVSRTMNGSIGIGLEDSSVVGIRTERTLGCGVIYAVAGILAMLAGVEEVVDAVALEDEWSFEEVSNLGVRDELGFAE